MMDNKFHVQELQRSQSPVSSLASGFENLFASEDQPKVQRCLFPGVSVGGIRRTQSFDLTNKVRKLEEENAPTARRKKKIMCIHSSIDVEPPPTTEASTNILNEETQLPETLPIRVPSFSPPRVTCIFDQNESPLFKAFPTATRRQDLFSSRVTPTNNYLSKSDSQLLDSSSQPNEPLGSPPHSSSVDFTNNSIGEETSLLLPIVESKQSIPYVSADIVSKLLSGDKEYSHINYTIVDCRYEFEFNGGHIKGAQNIKTPQELENKYLRNPAYKPKDVLIFHCEFSSYRGPNLCLHLRNRDRQYHHDSYPLLYYPQLYVLKDGFKNFYECYPHLCDPSNYVPMLDPRFKEELKQYKQFLRNDSVNKVKRSFSTGDIKFPLRRNNH